MNISNLSLKNQIVLAFLFLILPLFVMNYFYIISQKHYVNSIDNSVKIETVFTRVANLEKNVVDMQRNVFLYQKTKSKTSEKNIESIYLKIIKELPELEKLGIFSSYHETLISIQNHLSDYKNNFDTVKDYTEQIEEILKSKDTAYLTTISSIENLSTNNQLNSKQKELVAIKNLINLAYKDAVLYSISSNVIHSDSFRSHLTQSQSLLTNENLEELQLNILNFNDKFNQLVTLNRNYIYLINVVMAGNANEILYNAQFLSRAFREKAENNRRSFIENMEVKKNLGVSLSMAAVILAIITAAYFFTTITNPIIKITQTFEQLTSLESVDQIPGLHRNDELGSLARAAAVFKKKNLQTLFLLRAAEDSIKTQQKLNNDLKQEKLKAEKALAVRTDFLANMSHELRTPMNSIIGFTSRVLKKPESLNNQQIKALKTVEKNGHHLLTLINDILDLSKIEANKLELTFISFDLKTIVGECIEQLSVLAESKQLKIFFNADNIDIVSDPIRIQQICINLISNAIKYTETGWIRCELIASAEDQMVTLKVIDTGRGISLEDQQRLFTRFEQINDNVNTKIGMGTGLGLAIVANICKLLGCEVSVDSELGEGSTFFVRIPYDINKIDLERPVDSDSSDKNKFSQQLDNDRDELIMAMDNHIINQQLKSYSKPYLS